MFGCIASGRLVQTNLQQVSPNKYVFELQDAQNIDHLIVFLLGTIPFEPGFAATVHFMWPNQEWKLLGGLSNDKASAIFRLAKNSSTVPTVATLGISIEPIEAVGQELAALKSTGGMKNVSPEMTVTQVGHLAGRILENIFNHVAMFTVNNVPISTVPLPQLIEQGFLSIKDFQNWYKSLKRKSQADPHFLDS